MGDSSSIEWTDATWNPVTGCSKVSPGCAHCYAEGIAFRGLGRFGQKYSVPSEMQPGLMRRRRFEEVQCHDEALDQPLHWRKPRRIFVNSMSDLFHEDVPDAFIDRVFAVMALAPQHTFQILTKRAERMRDYLQMCLAIDGENGKPLPNVWLGVSVENQHFADERIPLLLETPAAVRFISAEPLLGAVDASFYLDPICECETRETLHSGDQHDESCPSGAGKLDWVIVGGESGSGARPMDLAWARSIVEQCKSASVPVFVKQLGAYPTNGVPYDRGEVRPRGVDGILRKIIISNRKGGDQSEWPEDLRVREFPAAEGAV